jgi:hypothetical protein
MGTVAQELCEERNTKIHERLDAVSDKTSKIIGGIIVISFGLALFITGVFYHINYRFSSVEKTLEKIENKIDKK